MYRVEGSYIQPLCCVCTWVRLCYLVSLAISHNSFIILCKRWECCIQTCAIDKRQVVSHCSIHSHLFTMCCSPLYYMIHQTISTIIADYGLICSIFAAFSLNLDMLIYITYRLYISPLSMAAVEQLTTKDLLFPFRDSFHSIVDIESLIVVMDQNQLLRRKEMKLLQRVDETAKKSYIFTKLNSADQSLSANRLVQLFTETANERNLQFSKALTSILSSAQKSDTIGQYIYSTYTSLQRAHCCGS